MDQDDDYTVGYGKPPRATQFRKGKSGNPKGRPKTPTGPDSHLMRELEKLITVTENGQRRRISKSEALMTRLVNGAISGELAAARMICRQIELLRPKPEPAAAAPCLEQQKVEPKDYTDAELVEIITMARLTEAEEGHF